MSYKRFQTMGKIGRLYEEADKLTSHFTNFSVIEKRPDILLIIRLASGLSQKKFSEAIRIDRSILAHYELGIAKKMKASTQQRIAKNLSALKHLDFSETVIRNNFKFLWEFAKNGQDPDILRERGRKALKSKMPTVHEKRIEQILANSGTKFEREGSLTLSGMKFSFDFVLPHSRKPAMIIESKGISARNKHSFRVVCYRICYEVGYKSRLLKSEYPDVQKVLIIESNIQKLPERVDTILKKENDIILINPSNEEIKNLFSGNA